MGRVYVSSFLDLIHLPNLKHLQIRMKLLYDASKKSRDFRTDIHSQTRVYNSNGKILKSITYAFHTYKVMRSLSYSLALVFLVLSISKWIQRGCKPIVRYLMWDYIYRLLNPKIAFDIFIMLLRPVVRHIHWQQTVLDDACTFTL